MSIRGIELISFRNHNNRTVEFSPGLNVIWGENGSGKTSILEAIYSLSIGRSFRTSDRKQMIQKEKDYFRIVGKFESQGSKSNVAMSQLKDGRRKITFNDEAVKGFRNFVGRNPVVLLSPEEQGITKGVPAERRMFFDKLFSIASHDYFEALTEFNRVLKQRNSALSAVKEGHQSPTSIHPWNEPLAECAQRIWGMRENLWEKYSNHLKGVVQKLNDNSVDLEGLYSSKALASKEDFLITLEKNERRDIALQRTMSGPQKDDYSFLFNNEDIRQFGSQGEHKLALILIKLAEFKFIQELNDTTPIILLDDVLAKLDFHRSEVVMALLEKNVQTIITTTNLVNVESHGIDVKNTNNMSLYLERPCSN